jgi:hypothetical protein
MLEYRKNARYQEMDEDMMYVFMSLFQIEKGYPDFKIPKKQIPPEAAILKQRIDVLDLPLKYTEPALVVLAGLAGRIGFCILALIDCLNILVPLKKDLTVENIGMHVYPNGFYTNECASEIINKYMKTKIADNSNIY